MGGYGAVVAGLNEGTDGGGGRDLAGDGGEIGLVLGVCGQDIGVVADKSEQRADTAGVICRVGAGVEGSFGGGSSSRCGGCGGSTLAGDLGHGQRAAECNDRCND